MTFMAEMTSVEGMTGLAPARQPAAAVLMDPWLSPLWVELWWRQLGSHEPGRHLRPLQSQEGQTLLPLVGSRWHGVRRLQGAGGESLRHSLPGGPEAWAAAAQQLAQARDWDWADLSRMLASDAQGLSAALAEHGLKAELGPALQQRFVPLDRDWAEVVREWKPTLRQRLPRQERALQSKGVSLAMITAAGPAARAFERCLQLEAAGWKGREGSAMLSRPGVADFYRQLVVGLAEQGLVQLYLLERGEELVAFDLSVLTPRGLAGLKVGMAEAWRSWVPGLVLHLWVMRAAHAQGLGEYDFLGGDERYKADWTPHTRSLCRLQVFARSARGRALVLARQVHSRMRQLRRSQPAKAETDLL